MFEQVRRHFKSLPVHEYPTIVALADYLSKDDPNALLNLASTC